MLIFKRIAMVYCSLLWYIVVYCGIFWFFAVPVDLFFISPVVNFLKPILTLLHSFSNYNSSES